MALDSLPEDVFVLVAQMLSIRDVLALRKVSKGLCELTHVRSLWFTLIRQYFAVHGVPRFSAQFAEYETPQLEAIVMRPSKLQLALAEVAAYPNTSNQTTLSSLGLESPAADLPIRRRPLTLLRESSLAEEVYTAVRITRGGRWLITMSSKGVLRVWDLDPPWSPQAATEAGSENLAPTSPVLRGEKTFNPYWVLDDVDISEDGSSLNILMNIEIVREHTATVICLDLTTASTHAHIPKLPTASSWKFPPNTTARAFLHDVVIFLFEARGTERLAVWNWKLGKTILLLLHGPSWSNQILQLKLITPQYLLVVHGVGQASRCTACIYALPTLDELVQQKARLVDQWSDGCDDNCCEVLEPLNSYDIRGMHHVQEFRPQHQRHSTSLSPSTSSLSPPDDSHRLSLPSPTSSPTPTNRRHPLSFTIGSVAISEPYWNVPPKEQVGQCRICIAVESLLTGTLRTRLHYLLTVNLEALSCGGLSSIEHDGMLAPANPIVTLMETEPLPTPSVAPTLHPKGRITTHREGAIYYRDRLAVAVGSRSLLSVWTSPGGVNVHITGTILKRKSTQRFRSFSNEADASQPGPSTSRQPPGGNHAVGSMRDRPSSSRSRDRPGSSRLRASNSNVSLNQDCSRGNDGPSSALDPVQNEAYKERGVTRTVHAWAPAGNPSPHPHKPMQKPMAADNTKSFFNPPHNPGSVDGLPTARSKLNDLSNPYHVLVDIFSGRIVVLHEVQTESGRETIVRILEFSCP